MTSLLHHCDLLQINSTNAASGSLLRALPGLRHCRLLILKKMSFFTYLGSFNHFFFNICKHRSPIPIKSLLLYLLWMDISEELRITEILLHCLYLIKHPILSQNVHKWDGTKLLWNGHQGSEIISLLILSDGLFRWKKLWTKQTGPLQGFKNCVCLH